MSVISRFSRLMSSSTIAISLSRRSGSRLGRAATSIAERSEVSGFLSSCATSAAKLSMVSMRCHSASVIERSASFRSPISSPRLPRSGISGRLSRASRTSSAARASRTIGWVMVPAR